MSLHARRPRLSAAKGRRIIESDEEDVGVEAQRKRARTQNSSDEEFTIDDKASAITVSDSESDDGGPDTNDGESEAESNGTPSLQGSHTSLRQDETDDVLDTPADEQSPSLGKVEPDIPFGGIVVDLSNAPTPSMPKNYRQNSISSYFPRPRDVAPISNVTTIGKAASSPLAMASSAAKVQSSGSSSKSSVHPFFLSRKDSAKRQRQLDDDFIDDGDDSGDDYLGTTSKKAARGSAKVGGAKTAGSGQKWTPSFRQNRTPKRIDHCPSPAQATEMMREADRMSKAKLWPPMSDLSEIYADIVDRMPEALLRPLASTLSGKGRALRVATMCSGTESPLLALQLISRAIEAKWGIKMGIEHVFSCELEPFKQAYIERNFSPPILFRDVTELGKPKAHTAYGALVDVPGDIDLLVAGTSCVDYSGLNNAKKALSEGGESGRTFFGMLEWVKRNKPAIVILENVKSAPWEGVGKFFEDAKYDSTFSTRFDTKNYYIPQTRQRGYFFASRNTKDDYPANWHNLVTSLQRPASSPIEAFMLPSNDSRIQAARAKMGYEEAGKSRSTVDWSKCQGRHEEARGFEKLGQARPFTAWEEGGSCVMSHGAWNEFARPQPERVLDLMDITVLRDAKRNEDPHFKSRVWELSQNVDRNIVAPQPGITGCLTPSGMPFLTSRGGPVTGLEALSLQGLPINELLLTRESDDQLQNLAGNAMSSTVVGVCILAALVLARPDLEEDRSGDNLRESSRMHKDSTRGSKSVDVLQEDKLAAEAQPYDLTSMALIDMPDLLARAHGSSQLCICESGAECKRDIYRCKLCDQTSCGTCKSRPSHAFELDTASSQGLRTSPRAFEDYLKGALPMRLVIDRGQSQSSLAFSSEAIAHAAKGVASLDQQPAWNQWSQRVVTALEHAEFRFSRLIRARQWTAEFHSSSARLELVLDAVQPRWQLFVEPSKAEPEGSVLRKLLLQPVAQQRLDPQRRRCAILDAGDAWEINLPVRFKTMASVTAHGEQVDTWQASLGVRGEMAGSKRYSEMHVDVSDKTALELLGKRPLCGNYKLLPDCGQANASLHKRDADGDATGQPPSYLFIEAARYGSSSDDAFVFGSQLGLLDYPQERTVTAQLKLGWKPDLAPRDPTMVDDIEMTAEESKALTASYLRQCEERPSKKHKVELTVVGKWVALPSLRLSPYSALPSSAQLSTIAVPRQGVSLDLAKTACDKATAVLTCTTPLSSHSDDTVWPRSVDKWTQIDLEHHGKQVFAKLAWLTERVPEVKAWQQWMSAKMARDEACIGCLACAPAPPSIQWLKKGNTPPVPIENEREAGPFEQAMKNRPFPFLLHLMRDANDCARLRIAVNAATLMHRALSRLPTNSSAGQPEPAWRLTRIDPSLTPFNLPKYSLSSNRHDAQAVNPAAFKLELRKEQKRSLTWMLAQEAEEAEPFVEEEVSEAALPALEWCAEGRARREHIVRGGVIADAVGYGKTAISLALIATQKEKEAEKAVKPVHAGLIDTKATLVIVPPQLCKQWENEVHKFLGKKLSVHVIFSKTDLNKTTVDTLRKVDIVIMSVSVYKSDAYFESLAAFAAANPIPAKEGRFFESALNKSVKSLPARVGELMLDDRGRTLWKSITARADFDPSHLTTYKARKRIVGAQYAREKALQDVASDDDQAETVEDAWAAIKKEKIADVWGLKTGLKRWGDLTSPPLEAFSWRRVIIDEFHYIAAEAGRVFSTVRALKGHSTWVLSGTPKTGDFSDIRSMAAFLNVHLGVEDDADYAFRSGRGRTSRNKLRSDVERFRSFVEVHSPAWHHRRQAIGQAFLDRFVRQNIAEIDEIASIDILKPVRMPAAERACYLELQHTIEALDLRHARSLFRGPAKAKALNSENDRDHRLRTTLGESSSPEEALSRQAAHFVLSARERAKNAIEACDLIVAERADQLARCKQELVDKLAAAREQHFLMTLHYGYRDDSKQALISFAKNAVSAKYGDRDSKQAIFEILETAGCLEADLTTARGRKLYGGSELKEALKRRAAAAAIEEHRKQRVAAAKKAGKGKGAKKGKNAKVVDSDDECSDSSDVEDTTAQAAEEKKVAAKAVKELEASLSKGKKLSEEERQRVAWLQETHARALVHHLVQLRNETAARQRSLRYFEHIRSIQLSRGRSISGECPSCRSTLTFETLAISSVCGHLFCETCGRREAWKGNCPEVGCNADAKPTSIVSATTLGVENEEVSAFGEKMSQLARLLRDERLIPRNDKVILFVQFEGLLQKTAHALTAYGVKFTRVRGNARQRSQTLDDYQRGAAPRVLLLDVADESAAGSNLTIANHVIFLSSLVTEDQATYEATLQQARGRCLRFGQTKEVHVWHLLARSTIDEEIFDRRAGSGRLEEALETRSQRQEKLGRQLSTETTMEEEAADAKKKDGERRASEGGRGSKKAQKTQKRKVDSSSDGEEDWDDEE
ncbi:unnamed protein product [Parajaminaea phylloscopi]